MAPCIYVGMGTRRLRKRPPCGQRRKSICGSCRVRPIAASLDRARRRGNCSTENRSAPKRRLFPSYSIACVCTVGGILTGVARVLASVVRALDLFAKGLAFEDHREGYPFVQLAVFVF